MASRLDLSVSWRRKTIRQSLHISEILAALKQLPGLAIQRLMEKGYGFGGEGDWKTAAMVRLMKIMTQGTERCKGNFLYGGLYLQSGTGQRRQCWRHICWRSARRIADGPISIKVTAADHGRQRRSCTPCIYRKGRSGSIATSLIDLGRPLPSDHQQM